LFFYIVVVVVIVVRFTNFPTDDESKELQRTLFFFIIAQHC